MYYHYYFYYYHLSIYTFIHSFIYLFIYFSIYSFILLLFNRYKFSGYEDDVDDLKTVITQLRKDGFTPFCLFGHSRGANDVLIYSSKFCKNGAIGKDGKDSNEEGTDSVLQNKNDDNNEIKKGKNEEIKMNLKLPKTTEEMKLEKTENKNEIKTPTSITTTSSSVLLSDLNNDMNNKINFDKVASILSEKEIEKEIVILKENQSDDQNDESLHELDAEKLLIVVAAPRFDMPKMLTTLFSEDQISKLSLPEVENKFEWQSSEKGKENEMKSNEIKYFNLICSINIYFLLTIIIKFLIFILKNLMVGNCILIYMIYMTTCCQLLKYKI